MTELEEKTIEGERGTGGHEKRRPIHTNIHRHRDTNRASHPTFTRKKSVKANKAQAVCVVCACWGGGTQSVSPCRLHQLLPAISSD